MIAPGRYVVASDIRCWSEFMRHADGRVSTWSTRSPEGAEWLADMETRLGRGELRKEESW